MSKPVANPYARRKQAPSASTGATAPAMSASTTTAAQSSRPAAASSAPAVARAPPPGAASFSQAFQAIEDTTHYQGLIQRNKDTAVQESVQQRAQQRAFDATAQDNFLQATKAAGLTDRDQHALLQQPHVLYVSNKQRGNAILSFIRNVPWAYTDMVPDYIMSTTRCALFLSIRYHSLHPEYIHKRVASLRTDFALRVLLVLVDVKDNATVLAFLNKYAVTNKLTLVLAWSEEEAARYLETWKAFDGKDAALIQKKEQANFVDQVADFLGTCKGVNKTDSGQLLQQFSNVRSLMEASMDELGLVTGMGEVKVRRLHEAFTKPFSKKAATAKRQRLMVEQEAVHKAAGEDDDDESETEFQFETDTAAEDREI